MLFVCFESLLYICGMGVILGIIGFVIWVIVEAHRPTVGNTKSSITTSTYIPPVKYQEPIILKPIVVKPVYTSPVVSNPTQWFIGEWGIGKPSPAEQLIINELDKYFLDWHREVSFHGLKLPSNGYARFDFWLPDHRLIIEYDSKKWHESPDRVENDEIKSIFCRTHDIKLIRLHSKHYYKMEQSIYDIMKELGVKEAIYPF